MRRLNDSFEPALLALSDGTLFHGISIGASGITTGEVVFNTSMSGYEEILTDPSYCEQIVTFTYPHIGSVGVNMIDQESKQIFARGIIMRDLQTDSNYRADVSLQDYLKQNGIVAISEIDTRALTRHLRDHGAQNACIMTSDIDSDKAIALANKAPNLDGLDLAKVVTTQNQFQWTQGTYDLALEKFKDNENTDHIVAMDFGVKRQILRLLNDRGFKITIVPATTSYDEIIALKPKGIFLSNGPGDPSACDYAIDTISKLLKTELPIFGICLGFQLLGLASGSTTTKMKFGHHGANHPVIDLATEKVYITSQNHGFMLDEKTLTSDIEVTHRSLFDDSIQGIKFKNKSVFGFQGHPEASPGPHDITYLFDQFSEMIKNAKTS